MCPVSILLFEYSFIIGFYSIFLISMILFDIFTISMFIFDLFSSKGFLRFFVTCVSNIDIFFYIHSSAIFVG